MECDGFRLGTMCPRVEAERNKLEDGVMWDLPGPGIEPMSPALAGGFFTTEIPGKSSP